MPCQRTLIVITPRQNQELKKLNFVSKSTWCPLGLKFPAGLFPFDNFGDSLLRTVFGSYTGLLSFAPSTRGDGNDGLRFSGDLSTFCMILPISKLPFLTEPFLGIVLDFVLFVVFFDASSYDSMIASKNKQTVKTTWKEALSMRKVKLHDTLQNGLGHKIIRHFLHKKVKSRYTRENTLDKTVHHILSYITLLQTR